MAPTSNKIENIIEKMTERKKKKLKAHAYLNAIQIVKEQEVEKFFVKEYLNYLQKQQETKENEQA